MKSSQLRSPLIGSAIVLALFTLVVYFRLTTPDGSIVGSFGSIVILIVKSIQIIIGMGLALLVSMAVLVAIFLGAVALNNPAASSRMYEGLRSALASWLAPLAGVIRSDRGEKLEQEMVSLKDGLKTDMVRLVTPVKKELAVLQEAAEKKVTGLKNRLCEVEEGVAAKASGEDLETLSGEIAGLTETVQGIESTLKELSGKIEQAGKVDTAEVLGDLPARMEALEQKEIPAPVDLQPVEEKIDGLAKTIAEATRPLQEKITALDGEIATLKEALAKPAQKAAAPAAKKAGPKKEAAPAPAKGEDEHRLLSYFEDPADKKKFKNLVVQTLKKDMTYAQVTKYLVKEMGKEKGKIISEHPALAKDYIRQCRRRG